MSLSPHNYDDATTTQRRRDDPSFIPQPLAKSGGKIRRLKPSVY